MIAKNMVSDAGLIFTLGTNNQIIERLQIILDTIIQIQEDYSLYSKQSQVISFSACDKKFRIIKTSICLQLVTLVNCNCKAKAH